MAWNREADGWWPEFLRYRRRAFVVVHGADYPSCDGVCCPSNQRQRLSEVDCFLSRPPTQGTPLGRRGRLDSRSVVAGFVQRFLKGQLTLTHPARRLDGDGEAAFGALPADAL